MKNIPCDMTVRQALIKPQNEVYWISSNSLYSFAAKWTQHTGILPLIFISIKSPS